MSDTLRLMGVMAHPDDESLGIGGTLAHYAAEGVETYLVTATRGERGWMGDEKDNPGLEALGKTREAELLAAAKILGLNEVQFLDYVDGDLDQADPSEAITKIVGHIRRVKPHVVLTFDPNGAYGHPDHIAICQFTTAACMRAADSTFQHNSTAGPHHVSKLYYMAAREELGEIYQSVFGELAMHIDGVKRGAVAWEQWAITSWLDTKAHWRTVWKAVLCHKTQLPAYSLLESLPEATHEALWGVQTYYRAYSTVNGGRRVEHDLFEGLR